MQDEWRDFSTATEKEMMANVDTSCTKETLAEITRIHIKFTC